MNCFASKNGNYVKLHRYYRKRPEWLVDLTGRNMCNKTVRQMHCKGIFVKLHRYYRKRPEWWADLSARNMRLDSSWGRSSEDYISLYRAMGQQ